MEPEGAGLCKLWSARVSSSCRRTGSSWPVYLLRRNQRRWVRFQAVRACTCSVGMLIIPADPNWITASRTAATRALFIIGVPLSILNNLEVCRYGVRMWMGSSLWCLSSSEKLEIWVLSADFGHFYVGMKSRSLRWVTLSHFPSLNEWNIGFSEMNMKLWHSPNLYYTHCVMWTLLLRSNVFNLSNLIH